MNTMCSFGAHNLCRQVCSPSVGMVCLSSLDLTLCRAFHGGKLSKWQMAEASVEVFTRRFPFPGVGAFSKRGINLRSGKTRAQDTEQKTREARGLRSQKVVYCKD